MSRIYAVKSIDTTDIALVRAGNPAQALRHVASEQFNVAVATQDELVQCVRDGVEVQTAGEQPPDGEPGGE